MPRFAKRDELETRQRGFLDPRSFCSRDGSCYLYGEDMSNQRHFVFDRSGGNCERCTREIYEETFHAHHRKTRGHGGSDDMSNLMALCQKCHAFMHKGRNPRWGEK